MPITISEKLISREHTDDRAVERVYNIAGVGGTSGDQDALDALKAEAPAEYRGLTRGPCRVEPTENDELWIGYAPYAPAQYPGFGASPETGASLFSFDTGGGSQHLTQAKGVSGSYGDGSDVVTDSKGVIGWTKDGIEGVDIPTAVFNFTLTEYKADDDINAAYIGALYNLTGKTNSGTFTVDVEGVELEFAVGEVLFLGASGSKRVGEDWEITLNFAASENATGLTVGDISGINKKGHEYMWVRYKSEKDATTKFMRDVPRFVYVVRVYDEGDFGPLSNVA